MSADLRELLALVPQVGRLEGIWVRPARRAPTMSLDATRAIDGVGLEGDRRTGARANPRGRRHVTLLQAEHLPVIAGLLGWSSVDAGRLRRNLVVAGINLASVRDRRFRVGAVTLEGTGWCHPCSRMEEELGPGGYQAVRHHGGITARVLRGGPLRVGDPVAVHTTTDAAQPPD
jgi:MOSC domain-containing protein YiiM